MVAGVGSAGTGTGAGADVGSGALGAAGGALGFRVSVRIVCLQDRGDRIPSTPSKR